MQIANMETNKMMNSSVKKKRGKKSDEMSEFMFFFIHTHTHTHTHIILMLSFLFLMFYFVLALFVVAFRKKKK